MSKKIFSKEGNFFIPPLLMVVVFTIPVIIIRPTTSVFQPNIGRLGIPHGPSGEKVAVVAVDDCDIAMAVRFGNQIGNYSCAAQGTQTGQKK